MKKDIKIIRSLANKYMELQAKSDYDTQLSFHRAVNDLKMIRPVVLIDEIPWCEMDISGELNEVVTNPILRKYERFFRRAIYYAIYIKDDHLMRPYLQVSKKVCHSGIGINVVENLVSTDSANNIVSHEYQDSLATEESLNCLHNDIITYDEVGTLAEYELLNQAIGDIIPIHLHGINVVHIHPWDDIARYRGVSSLLMDLALRPEFSHQMMEKFTNIAANTIHQYEELNLLDREFDNLHCTAAEATLLDSKPLTEKVTTANVWGRGAAQIFTSVSRDMHDEFDIEYIKGLLGQFGLVYYGCCEALHKKIDLVEKIPNLRKIGVSPWADIDMATEIIGKRYVASVKPQPSTVAFGNIDEQVVRLELTHIANAALRNNCSVDITLKDISTCDKNPQNIFKWARIAMEVFSK